MRFYIIILCLFVLNSACEKQELTLLDRAEKLKPYAKIKDILNMTMTDSIHYFMKDGEKTELSPLCTVINNNNNTINIIDRYLFAIISFKLDDFTNGSKPVFYVQKDKGKGPNDFSHPYCIVYDEKRDLYYISDMLNYSIYIYDTDFYEIDRFQIPFRPSKIVIYSNELFITSYDSPYNEFVLYTIDLDSYKANGLFALSKLGTQFEAQLRNQIMVAPLAKNHNFVTKNYPNFNIYELKDDTILLTFTSPSLKGHKLPKPEMIIRDNDRRVWGLSAFTDLIYDDKTNLLFVLTIRGWEELAEKLCIDRFILIFDQAGNCLAEYKFPNYGGGENSLCFDSKNEILYYIGFDHIKKFKLNWRN